MAAKGTCRMAEIRGPFGNVVCFFLEIRVGEKVCENMCNVV